MSYLRKTLRFKEDSPDEMLAYNALSNFSEFGFRSENQMIVDAIKFYINRDKVGNLSADELAEKIAQKLAGKISVAPPPSQPQEEEEKTDAYDTAFSFLDSL